MSSNDIDIVAELLDWCDCDGTGCTDCDAADEIKRLRAEVERTRDYACRMDALAEERLMQATRLRTAGDALVDAVERQRWSTVDVAVAAWQKARRER